MIHWLSMDFMPKRCYGDWLMLLEFLFCFVRFHKMCNIVPPDSPNILCPLIVYFVCKLQDEEFPQGIDNDVGVYTCLSICSYSTG